MVDHRAIVFRKIVGDLLTLLDMPEDALRSALAGCDVPKAVGFTIATLCDEYLKYAESYYFDPDGWGAKESTNIELALRPLKLLYGQTLAEEFGPRRLKHVRDEMISRGWCRRQINHQVGRIKRMFKWATENELSPGHVAQSLDAVAGLRMGRSKARESEPVKPVPEELITAMLPFASPQVGAMVQLQLLTAMRPGEIVIMRACDIDETTHPWRYRPWRHKTAHHGHERTVYLGPRAQDILMPFLRRDAPAAFLFSPADADKHRRRRIHAMRRTPLSCGNRPGTNVKSNPKKVPGDRYNTQTYGRAITYACRAAFPMPDGFDAAQAKAWRKTHSWHPHQLRHNAATRLRREHGLDVAQAVLGHKSLQVTQVYAERNDAAASEVMAQTG